MIVNIEKTKKCAFCKHWYDPSNNAIKPRNPRFNQCLITEYNAGKQDGIELERKNTEKERLNTEKERQRADAATKKAAELEDEVKKLRAMLAK